MKSITIIRHAESSWDSVVATDFERPLNKRGFSDAKLMGDALVNKKINLDMIISSTANRAITTAKIIADQIKFNDEIKEEENIYGASYKDLFSMITKLDDSFDSMALVGHNPTLHILSENLSNKRFMKFPTCSIVHVIFDVNSWVKIQSGNLEYFLFPKLYRDIN